MSLPSRLQPLWPYFKQAHRAATLVLGLVFRLYARFAGSAGVPRRATMSSIDTAASKSARATLHPGGQAETFVRAMPLGEPAEHWRFQEGEFAHVPGRYVLEVDDGRLVGLNGATVTPDGVLDYQTSGYFGISGWRQHPLYLHPTIGQVEHIEGTALSLTTRGTAGNYYHFLYDAIARYGIFREAMPDAGFDAVIVPHQTRYQRQFLDLIGIEKPLLQPRQGLTYRADRLLVPSTPNQDLDAPRWVTRWLRENLPARPTSETPKRLYLSRGAAANTRRYVQEREILPELEQRGFMVLDPGTLSVQDQINTFAGAEIVVAPHGAALTNITFCSPGTRVLEMFAATYVHLGLWTIADAVGNIDYRYLVADGAYRPGAPMVGVLDDVSIPVERVLRVIDEMLA